MSIVTTRAPAARSGALRRSTHVLSWLADGEGPAILVVGSATYYPRVFSQGLRRHVQLAFVDHRGFGRPIPGAPAEPIDLDTIVADIEAVRRRLGLERPIVLGHSGHAYMALAYAAAHPEQVSGLAMVAAGPSHAPAVMALAERRWDELVAPARKAAFAEGMAGLEAAIAREPERRFVALCLSLGAKMWADPRFDAAPLWAGVETDAAVFDALWGDAFARIDTGALLERVTVPVLVALGRLDYAVAPPESWDAVRRRVGDLAVRVFEACAHTPMLEQPEAFDETLLAFVARCGNGI